MGDYPSSSLESTICPGNSKIDFNKWKKKRIETRAFLFPFQVPLVLWDLQGLQESPRRLLSSQGLWVHRAGEAPQGHRERWGPRAPQENQVIPCCGPAGIKLVFLIALFSLSFSC